MFRSKHAVGLPDFQVRLYFAFAGNPTMPGLWLLFYYNFIVYFLVSLPKYTGKVGGGTKVLKTNHEWRTWDLWELLELVVDWRWYRLSSVLASKLDVDTFSTDSETTPSSSDFFVFFWCASKLPTVFLRLVCSGFSFGLTPSGWKISIVTYNRGCYHTHAWLF